MIQKDMQKLMNKNNVYLLIGFTLLFWYLWIRILKVRLPQNIPFTLSFYSAMTLFFLCLMYVYIIYRIIKPKQNSFLMHMFADIIKYIKMPLNALDDYLRNNIYSKQIIYIVCKTVIMVLHFNQRYKRSLFIYLYCMVIPKVIWLFCLMIDCIYYRQVNLTYFYSIVLIMPLLVQYTLYNIRISKKNNLTFLDNWFLIEITSKDIVYNTQDYDSNGCLKYHVPTYYMNPSDIEYDDQSASENTAENYSYLTVSQFIDIQEQVIYWQHRPYEYKVLYQNERKDYISFHKKEDMSHISKNKCNNLISFYAQGSALEKHINSSMKHNLKEINIIQITINFLLLLCWSYILIVSLHTLPENILLLFMPKYNNPFVMP